MSRRDDMTPGDVLRVLRQAAGLSQRDLAARLGWEAQSSVSNVERNVVQLDIPTAVRYADAVGVRRDRLLVMLADAIPAGPHEAERVDASRRSTRSKVPG